MNTDKNMIEQQKILKEIESLKEETAMLKMIDKAVGDIFRLGILLGVVAFLLGITITLTLVHLYILW